MRRVTVALPGRDYDILIGPGMLAQLDAEADRLGLGSTAAVVTDDQVGPRYARGVAAALESTGRRVATMTVPAGEGSKSLEQLGQLWGAFADAGLDRKSFVVALGGGVVGDLAGFAAATYLRGVDYVQVPTTLLAQVDASVGGKTAIDLPQGKNLVGSFHQPRLVLVDLDTLASLPDRDFRAGLAEIVKYGVIADPSLLPFIASNREAILRHDSDALIHLIVRSCKIKAAVVGADERESGRREILNFGHTIGHAVETVAGYGEYLHGEAVSIGMVAAARLSAEQWGLPSARVDELAEVLRALELPTTLDAPLAEERLLAAMRLDKKSRDGGFRFVLAREWGDVATAPLSEAAVRSVLPTLRR